MWLSREYSFEPLFVKNLFIGSQRKRIWRSRLEISARANYSLFKEGGATRVTTGSRNRKNCTEVVMEKDGLRKFLAGLCIASLLAGASLTAGCSSDKSASG